ncbi:LysE family translocator [Thalassospira sp. ER-Se-21-Dark]|uniref:LysE family translocator n=1 Tax=Thalassospira sp. ER-Se-21-Dark TaxID=2585190 RepID=UPI001B30F2AE|nr:LysE family translocator [Thalassospira sp. ER-Se-21-Dark]MBP3126124.1 LysE family translocator [Thalassospira sp. ER-Se-21-Dark]
MPETLLPVLSFTMAAALSPGGATTLATASGAQFGFRRSVPFIMGISIGMLTLAAAGALGLANLVQAFPSIELITKLIGTSYLVWLAFKIAMAPPPTPSHKLETNNEEQNKPIPFLGAFGLLWLNPKGWAVTIGAAASFSAITQDPTQLALILGSAFAFSGFLSMALWCALGLSLSLLLTSDWQWRAVNVTLGVLLVASIIPMWL